jgi:phosphoglycerate dehydrogenase-like enzyme
VPNLTEPLRVALLGATASEAEQLLAGQIRQPAEFLPVEDPGDAERLARALNVADAAVATAWPEGAGRAPRLRLVQHTGAGTDLYPREKLPLAAYLCNVYEHEPAMAEHVLMVMIALRRGLLSLDRRLRRGEWGRNEDGGIPTLGSVVGSTLGIVGFGRIGRALVGPARAFEIEVIGTTGHEPQGDPPEGVSFLGGPGALDDVLRRSDAVVVATPLNERTRGLIGERELGLMKRDALLINVARGPVVDEEALFRALTERRIGGAAIDVWYRYPVAGEVCLPGNLPFHELDNVVLTPHLAGWTEQTANRRWSFIAGNLDRLARGERPANVVMEPGAG